MTERTALRQLGTDTAYVLLGFPLALVSYIILVPGLALSIGLLPLGIGVFIGAGTLLAARLFGDLERIRLPGVLNRAVPRPVYRKADSGAWKRALSVLGDVQSWLDLVHGIFGFILSIFAFVFVFTWWSLALGGVFYFTYDWALPRGENDKGLVELLGMADSTANRIFLHTAIGLLALLTLPLIARGCALLRAGFGRALLTGVAEIRNRIERLEDQRAAGAAAEATALRRLERDIHDGPQQRLVRLAMDISRAKQQMQTDPASASSTLDEALSQTRETLDELRSLSRGIAPPVLTDRGLPSALAALAGRCTVPADLAVDERLGRLGPAVESAAYFVVAEALTNVAKHSQATQCEVTIVKAEGVLGVEIMDDGVGGAHLAKGHGLAGLADRVRAVGGTLSVTSPVGGPTLIRAEIPT